MNKDRFAKMVEDGRGVISILESVPEDKRPMLSVIAGAYIDGMIAQERQTAQDQAGGEKGMENTKPIKVMIRATADSEAKDGALGRLRKTESRLEAALRAADEVQKIHPDAEISIEVDAQINPL